LIIDGKIAVKNNSSSIIRDYRPTAGGSFCVLQTKNKYKQHRGLNGLMFLFHQSVLIM